MSNRSLLPLAVLLLAAGTAACSVAAAPSATPPASDPPATVPPSPTATPAPVITGIAHPTGAEEIVLRYDSSGGFVPPEFLAARVPMFSLYGDGRIIFVQTTVSPREADIGTGQPIRTATLSEEQVQALLEYALGEGGLAVAREEYMDQMVSDAPTTVFTINADNDSKTVSAYALGFQQQPGPDSQVLQRLAKLAERLGNFDEGGTIPSDPYQAPAYRGVLTEAQGVQGVPIAAWPFADLAPSDFVLPKDPNVFQQATHELSAEQGASLGVEGFENGITGGLWVRGPEDGKVYSLVVRPLLPGEEA